AGGTAVSRPAPSVSLLALSCAWQGPPQADGRATQRFALPPDGQPRLDDFAATTLGGGARRAGGAAGGPGSSVVRRQSRHSRAAWVANVNGRVTDGIHSPTFATAWCYLAFE